MKRKSRRAPKAGPSRARGAAASGPGPAAAARLAAIVESSDDAIVSRTLEGILTSWNTGAEKMYGYTAAEMLGRPIAVLVPPGRGDELDEINARLRRGETTRFFETTRRHKDGHELQVSVTVSPLRDAAGKVIGAATIARDITQRKQAEEQLAVLKQAVDAHYDGAYWFNGDNRLVYVNDAGCRAVGYSREELIGRPLSFLNPRATPEGLAGIWQHLRTERTFSTETVHRRKDGTEFQVEVAASYVRVGEREYNCGFARDITERKRAEAELRANEERYRSLFENMLNGFAYCRMLFDQDRPVDFVYLAVNRAFESLTGLKSVVGRKVSEVIPGIQDTDPKLMEIYGRVARTGRPEFFETYVEALQMWFAISAYSPAKDHFVAVFDVISERKQAEAKLRLFRELIERSSDAIEVIDSATGRFLDVNETACRMLGYPRNELLAHTIFDVDRDVDRTRFAARSERLAKAGSLTFEARHWRKDGTSLPVEVSISPVKLDREYRVAIVRDITGRKRIEDDLRVQVAALNATANAIAITNPEGTIQWANAAFAALSGYSVDEFIGHNPRELVKSGTQGQAFYQQLWDTILAGRVWRGEIVNRRKDGTQYTEEMTITPVRDPRGAIAHFIAIKQDVSDRKRAEARLAEQAALLDRASDAIYVTAMDCTILYWNPAAERIYGWSAAEAVGRKTSELNSVGEDLVAEALAQTLEKGEWIGERHQSTKAGGPVDVLSRLTLLRNEQGRPPSILVINTDITAKKELEARFLRAQRLESIGALASGIAHDLNNVLAPITMSIPLLRESVRDDTARSLVSMVEASAQRGAAIVRQVLTFARGTEGQRVALQLRPLVRDAVKMAQETFPKLIEIVDQSAAELWPVEVDPTQVHQALLNLCVNARDAMPAGGRLIVAAENVTLDAAEAAGLPGAKAGSYVRLRVTDTGTGIPAEVQERIFEPFFTTKGAGQGTGLGLSTVLGIVKGHGGFVRVDSTVGRGTTFELYFPALPLAPAARSSAPAQSTPPWPRAEGDLILLVDDEAAVREVARQALEEFGYRVMVSGTGAEAIRWFRASRGEIRLVITDLMMPEMDGPTLIAALRQLDPAVGIVGITGVADAGTAASLKDAGLTAIVAKPFTIGELLGAIRQALPAARGEKL